MQDDTFSETYLATIGVDFVILAKFSKILKYLLKKFKTLPIENKKIKLQIVYNKFFFDKSLIVVGYSRARAFPNNNQRILQGSWCNINGIWRDKPSKIQKKHLKTSLFIWKKLVFINKNRLLLMISRHSGITKRNHTGKKTLYWCCWEIKMI